MVWEESKTGRMLLLLEAVSIASENKVMSIVEMSPMALFLVGGAIAGNVSSRLVTPAADGQIEGNTAISTYLNIWRLYWQVIFATCVPCFDFRTLIEVYSQCPPYLLLPVW